MSDVFQQYEESEEWEVINDVPLYRPVRIMMRLVEAIAEDSRLQYQMRPGWNPTRFVDVAFKNLPAGGES